MEKNVERVENNNEKNRLSKKIDIGKKWKKIYSNKITIIGENEI